MYRYFPQFKSRTFKGNLRHESSHSSFFARNGNENPSSNTDKSTSRDFVARWAFSQPKISQLASLAQLFYPEIHESTCDKSTIFKSALIKSPTLLALKINMNYMKIGVLTNFNAPSRSEIHSCSQKFRNYRSCEQLL